MTKKIITKTAASWLDDEGIIRAVLFDQAEENLETAKENIAACLELSGGNHRLILIDMSKLKSMDKAARDYYARGDKRENFEKAVALIVKSPISRIIGNFFMGINKTTAISRLFTDEEKAVAWLREFL